MGRLLLVLLSSLALERPSVAAPETSSADVKCGAYCTFIGLKAIGLVEGTHSAFEKTIPPPGPSGYSMEDLDRIAKGRGAATLAVEADLDTLATLTRPNACIAFVDQHFLIIKWINLETKTVSLIDPPLEYDLPFKEFRRRFSKRSLVLGVPSAPPLLARSTPWTTIIGWSAAAVAGLILVGGFVARKPRRGMTSVALPLILGLLTGCGTKAKLEPPMPRVAGGLRIEPPMPRAAGGLRIEHADHHIGKVFASTPDQTITRENRLVNESSAPIRLLEIRKSCTCTSVDLESTTIPVGGSTKLKSTFELGSRPGPNRVWVELIVDTPDSSSRMISFNWDVVTPMFAEISACNFGRLEPTQAAERRVTLMDRSLPLCPNCQLLVEPNHHLIVGEVELERKAESPGHPTELVAPGPQRRLGSVLVSIRPGGEPGDYHQGVSVILKCRGLDRAKLELPVNWSIRPSVEAQPSRLWLSTARVGTKVSKRITLRSNDGSPLHVDRLSGEPSDFLAESKVSTEPDGSLAIDLTFAILGDPGYRRGGLTIFQGGGKPRPLVVPVSYLVQTAVPVDGKP